MIQHADADIAEMVAAIESMSDGFGTLRAVYDDAGGITDFEVTYVNPAAMEELQLSREEIIGAPLAKVGPAVESLGLLAAWRSVMETGKPSILNSVHYSDGDNDAYFDVHAWRFGDGVAVRWRSVDEQTEAMRLRTLGRLAGGIAHDFNNLLAVISNYSDFVAGAIDASLRSGDIGHLGEAARDIEHIATAAERATARTRQLLAFARRDSTRAQPVDISGVVQGALESLTELVGDNVALRTRLVVHPPSVIADPVQLVEALVQLTLNAIDAMPNGGTLFITTQLAARRSLEGVELVVRDNGVGMTEAAKAQAFEPFFTTKDLGSSAGLGLATVHGVVCQAGGKVSIESERGRGTTIVCWFPLAMPQSLPACAG